MFLQISDGYLAALGFVEGHLRLMEGLSSHSSLYCAKALSKLAYHETMRKRNNEIGDLAHSDSQTSCS